MPCERVVHQAADLGGLRDVGGDEVRGPAGSGDFRDEAFAICSAPIGGDDGAPSRAKARAVARPMPLPAPVITTLARELTTHNTPASASAAIRVARSTMPFSSGELSSVPNT